MNYSNSQRAGVILYLTALLFGAYTIFSTGTQQNSLNSLMNTCGQSYGDGCITDENRRNTESMCCMDFGSGTLTVE